MKTTVIMSIDRIEGETVVCFDGDGKEYLFKKSTIPSAADGRVFLAESDDGKSYEFVSYLPNEEKRRRESAEEQLHRLFGRKKNN